MMNISALKDVLSFIEEKKFLDVNDKTSYPDNWSDGHLEMAVFARDQGLFAPTIMKDDYNGVGQLIKSVPVKHELTKPTDKKISGQEIYDVIKDDVYMQSTVNDIKEIQGFSAPTDSQIYRAILVKFDAQPSIYLDKMTANRQLVNHVSIGEITLSVNPDNVKKLEKEIDSAGFLQDNTKDIAHDFVAEPVAEKEMAMVMQNA